MRGKAFCGHCDKAFIPSYSKKKQIAYYYYSCSNHDESSEVCNNCPIRKLPAELIEDFAKAQFEKILKSKDILKLLSEKTGYPPRIILDIFYLELLGRMLPKQNLQEWFICLLIK